MAKKPLNESSADAGSAEAAHTFENLGRKVDEIPEIQKAEQALRHAREEFDKCQARYREAKAAAVEEIRSLREKNLADIVADLLNYVRKHPGQGLIGALLSGFFLGRVFRR